MFQSVSVLLTMVVLIAVQRDVLALNCYTCGTGTDGCGTSFNSKGSGVMQVSGSSNTYCAKTVYASNSNSIARGGTTSVVCTGTSVTMAASTSGTGSDGSTIYCCSSDLCNTSFMQVANVSLVMAVLVLTFLFKN